MKKKVFLELSKKASEELNVDQKDALKFFKYLHRDIWSTHIFEAGIEIEIPNILKTKYTKKGKKILEMKTKVQHVGINLKKRRMY